MKKRPFLPKREISRNLFAEPELFEAWAVITKFHSEAMKKSGAREGVSRNDLMVHYLSEDALAYWDDKGGFPASKAEWDEKVAAYAKRIAELKKRAEEAQEDSAADSQFASIAEQPKK